MFDMIINYTSLRVPLLPYTEIIAGTISKVCSARWEKGINVILWIVNMVIQ